MLDIPQGEVIKKAIGDLEQKILSESFQTDSIDLSTENRIKQELHHYTEMVWEMIESKKISTKINGWHRIHDDFMFKNWRTGLDDHERKSNK